MSASGRILSFAALSGILLSVAGCGGGVSPETAWQRANSSCGSAKPVRLIQHVHEFPSDNWIEVHCSDGSSRGVNGG